MRLASELQQLFGRNDQAAYAYNEPVLRHVGFAILLVFLACIGEAAGCPDDAVQARDGCLICTTAATLSATRKSPEVPGINLQLQPPLELKPGPALRPAYLFVNRDADPPRLFPCVLLI